ncbi:MAG: beta-lactamase family protein [Desulfobacterales bacterium]|nr:beta-lactamase family protein [Desulfobacterales bacterium]
MNPEPPNLRTSEPWTWNLMNTNDFTTVDRLMREGLAEGVFPGAVVLVLKDGRQLFHEPYGKADIAAEDPVTEDTLFDLASLTKPLATTLCTMMLIEDGRLRLEDRLGDWIPAFSDTDKAAVTIEHLLRHTSGLPEYRPYFEELVSRPLRARAAHLQKMLLNEERITAAGKKTRYSDIGFLVLQQVLENAAGRGLSELCREKIFLPLELGSLHFPKLAPPFDIGRYAATEKCPWRKRVLRGEVHDENAWALGGVAGHAGLFGSAADVGWLAQILLDRWNGDAAKGPFSSKTVRHFFSHRCKDERALGFDIPEPVKASCGEQFSKSAVGHLGFTGTSFWIDLESSLIVVLLTNRIHPSRENQKIREFRPRLHDAVCMAADVGR